MDKARCGHEMGQLRQYEWPIVGCLCPEPTNSLFAEHDALFLVLCVRRSVDTNLAKVACVAQARAVVMSGRGDVYRASVPLVTQSFARKVAVPSQQHANKNFQV